MISVLIAGGPNNVRIPCRMFENIEVGKKRCDELFGFEGKPFENGKSYYYGVDLDKFDDSEEAENAKRISNELFTDWYYGCGGVDGFTLKEVSFDTKFVGFDLD